MRHMLQEMYRERALNVTTIIDWMLTPQHPGPAMVTTDFKEAGKRAHALFGRHADRVPQHIARLVDQITELRQRAELAESKLHRIENITRQSRPTPSSHYGPTPTTKLTRDQLREMLQ